MKLFSAKKRKKELISYKCETCGRNVSTYRAVILCLGCGKSLCHACNTFILYPQDFQILKKREQRRVKQRAISLEKARGAEKANKSVTPIIGIIGIAFLIAMLIIDHMIFYAVFGALGGIFLVLAASVFPSFWNFEQRQRRVIHRQVRSILVKYNIQRVFHGQGTKKQQENEVKEKISIITCPECNTVVTATDLKYCDTCGAELKK
ncbi:MAG: hypothetical protein ACFFAS_19815 [Promethearchaeota archaeon]